MLRLRNIPKNVLLLALVSSLFAGCGKEEFVHTTSEASGSASGYLTIPAELDLLLVVDNTPSMAYPNSQLQARLPGLVSQLTSQGWNYHIAAIPTSPIPADFDTYVAPSITKVLVNPEHNTRNLPYSSVANPEYISAAYAVTSPSSLQVNFSINNQMNSQEYGLRGIYDALHNAGPTKFLREDSHLAIVVLSNGEDTSGMTASYWKDWIFNATGRPADMASSIQFIPMVAQSARFGDCWGENATRGSRYLDIGSLFGTPLDGGLNFCADSNMTRITNYIASQLNIKKQAYVTSHIVLDRAPRIIEEVTKNGVAIRPADSSRTFGWEYIGGPQTVPTITEPYNLNRQTGYVIRLYGSDRLMGTDRYNVRASY